MAAIALTAATLTACSSDDLATKESPVQKNNVVTLTATLSPKGGNGVTRALTDNGTTISSAWAVNEEICVEYTDNGDNFVDAKGIVTAVDGDGKATVTVNLVDPKDGNTNIYFHYPYSIAKGIKDLKTDQIGTLDDIAANFDDFDGDGTLNVTGGVPTLPSDVTMTRNVSIWKLAFKVGGSDITNSITALNINIGDGAREYDVTPSALDAIYVALGNVINTNVTITAATPSGNYSFTKDDVTLTPGYFYRSTVTLTAAAASGTYREYSDRTNFDNVAIPGGATTITSGTSTWAAGTYVVSGNVSITEDVHLTGDVNLILCDGAELTVNGCIFGGADYEHGFVYKLNIYGQALGTGKLTVDYSGSHSLGVVTASELNIHGGIVTVGGSGVYQGIEPGRLIMYHGTINATAKVTGLQPMGGGMTMYGGTVSTISTDYGPAFLLPEGGSTLTISGGKVYASTTAPGASAIEAVHSIVIKGGSVTAQGTGAGIKVYGASGTSCTISCGNIIANSTSGPGIDVEAYTAQNGILTISGGTVTATGGDGSAAGILVDTYAFSGATTEINATGGENMEGIISYYGTSTISGGTIISRGGADGGIGLGGNVTISGGTVTAIGGNGVSMPNGAAGYDGTLNVTGGKFIATGGANGGGTDGLGISYGSTIALTGVTMYEGDAANPATPAENQDACTKRYVIIK